MDRKHRKRRSPGNAAKGKLTERVTVNPYGKIKNFQPFQTQTHDLSSSLQSLRALPPVPSRPDAQATARRLRMRAETAKIAADSEVVREFHTDAV